MRTITKLNDNWFFKKIRNAAGEAVTLPHTWNAIDG